MPHCECWCKYILSDSGVWKSLVQVMLHCISHINTMVFVCHNTSVDCSSVSQGGACFDRRMLSRWFLAVAHPLWVVATWDPLGAILINCLPLLVMVVGVLIIFPFFCIYYSIFLSTIYLPLLIAVFPL